MRFTTCAICGNDKSPTNASLLIDDVVHCENCLKEKFPTDESLKGKKVVQQFDPTICVSCAKDTGDIPLKLRGSYPMCDTCLLTVEARIFPTWVKAFFAGVIVLVIFSLVWNWRFIEAYYQFKKIERIQTQTETPPLKELAALYADLSTNLPEMTEFKQLANYSRGVWLLSDDKSAEALQAFKGCTELPESYNIPLLLLQAEIGASYEKKDYHGFVNAATQFLTYDSSAVPLAQVASAYACVYASEKSDEAKSKAMTFLQRANHQNDTTLFFSQYVNRIEHRLATGEIIDKKTFEVKFPNGWTK